MEPWGFWAIPEGINLPDDIVAALRSHTATTEQIEYMQAAAAVARDRLVAAEPYVPYVRPS